MCYFDWSCSDGPVGGKVYEGSAGFYALNVETQALFLRSPATLC